MQHINREKVKVQIWDRGDGTGHFHRNLEIVYVLQGKLTVHLSHKQVELSEYVTVCNSSISDRNVLNDSLYKGASILCNIFKNYNRLKSLAYYIGSYGVSDDIDSVHLFYGESGLISKNLIFKPAAWFYQF